MVPTNVLEKVVIAFSVASAVVVLGVTIAGVTLVQRAVRQAAAQPPVSEPVFCDQEAKQCPDGSYIGRTGPKCEFAVCPADVKAEHLPWSACTKDTDCTLVFELRDYCRNNGCPSYAINKRNAVEYEAASAAAVKAIYPTLEVRPPCLPVMPPSPEQCQGRITPRCVGGVCRATAIK